MTPLTPTQSVPPGYKQTEVGVIPDEWDVKLLRSVAQIRSGIAKNANLQIADPVQVHYLRVANVQDGFLDLSEMSQIKVSRDDLRRFSVVAGDVLMNEGGDRDKLGRGAIWRGEYVPCVHQNHVFVVRCGTTILPDYLSTWCSGSAARRYFLLAGKQTTNLASINKTALGGLPVVVPSNGEQRAIAEALGDVDALLGALDRLITKKRDLKQAAMQQLLTGQTRLPGFHGEWTRLNMAEDSTLKARIGWQGLTTAEYLKTGNYYLVTGTDFADGRIAWSNCCYVAAQRYTQDRNIQLRPSDILLTKDGTIGKVAFVDELPGPATLNSGVFVIRPKDSAYHPRYFFYVLTSRIFDEFLTRLQAGSTITHLYQKDFVNFSFLAPATIAEQTAIAEVLSDMDAEVAALDQRRAKTQALKLGMMQELLTGRIRLVETPTNIIPLPTAKASATKSKTHNWQIEEAVMIGVLASQFGTEVWPLPRMRRVKLTYLFDRHANRPTDAYLKKAAGPYNPKTKYQGPEGIALKNGYVREHHNGKYVGWVAGEQIAQAERYFADWFPAGAKEWLEQFRFHKTDELELLATVDMAMEDLRKAGHAITLPQVKQVIQDHPEWVAKLSRAIFSDVSIATAMKTCERLFQPSGS